MSDADDANQDDTSKVASSLSSIFAARVAENDQNKDDVFWASKVTIYVVCGVSVLLVCLLIFGTWLFVRNRQLKREAYSITSSPSPPSHVPEKICLFPPAPKPSLHSVSLVQPETRQGVKTNKAWADTLTPTHTPPLRARKGLLERRGSNASLTLDLGFSSPESKKLSLACPPKESSTEEYLLSAGNRMSRKELRNCLKAAKTVHEEFWEIPMNHQDKIVVAGSGTKNRYRTIIPNEKSRVIIPETNNDPLTSYINANYIRGYGGEQRAYIATQGPMSHTVDDFWRMLWQERSPAIVMITKLKEKNKAKCESYLPEQQGVFDGIQVEILGEAQKPGYILKQLRLRYEDQEHHMLHYWYTSWPDHKAPATARQLLDLVKDVDLHRYDPVNDTVKGPVVVHCSAGIGRTGCFIGASIGRLQLLEEHMVDVLGLVCSMRMDRGGMVQTVEQYVFIHQVLSLLEKEMPPSV